MEAKKLYNSLEKDFKLSECKDDWSKMDFNEFISANFRKRFMGVVSDNTDKIDFVFTAVFPSDQVLSKIVRYGVHNSLLFTHHPMVWDIRRVPVFANISQKYLKEFKRRSISIYTLHVPLDRNQKYSTATTFAKALGLVKKGEFYDYFGVKVGIVGSTNLKTLEELVDRTALIVGHDIKKWKYGDENIKGRRVAVIGGGGNEVAAIEEIANMGINTFVTGITRLNKHSIKAHNMARKHGINLIGATHYSSEKFACMEMCKYFDKIGLPCEFVEDVPIPEDMG
jgi:putative NIF3 family GTP cyclohydrolase 1 type 2